jgi:hypothetical protein
MEWINVALDLVIIFGTGIVFITVADYILGLFIRIK